jgi:hypothetical protein
MFTARRTRLSALCVVLLLIAACSSGDKHDTPSAGSNTNGVTASSVTHTMGAGSGDTYSSRCSEQAAPRIVGSASFSRRAEGKTDLTLLLPPPSEPVTYDAISKPRTFGATKGEPTLKRDGKALELQTEVTFSQKPYVTFVVPIHCGDEAGQLSAAVSWEAEGTESGRPLTVEITPFSPAE